MLDVDWSTYALKRSSEHASGRVASRLFLVQDGQPRQLDETWARSMNLVNSFLDWAAGGVLQARRLEEVQAGRLVTALVKALEKAYFWRRRTTSWASGEGVKTYFHWGEVKALGQGEDVLSWGDVKTYFQLGIWSGKSFMERGGWSKSLGHGASRSSRRLVWHRRNVSFWPRVVAGKDCMFVQECILASTFQGVF